jgi:hypothetical protein
MDSQYKEWVDEAKSLIPIFDNDEYTYNYITTLCVSLNHGESPCVYCQRQMNFYADDRDILYTESLKVLNATRGEFIEAYCRLKYSEKQDFVCTDEYCYKKVCSYKNVALEFVSTFNYYHLYLKLMVKTVTKQVSMLKQHHLQNVIDYEQQLKELKYYHQVCMEKRAKAIEKYEKMIKAAHQVMTNE